MDATVTCDRKNLEELPQTHAVIAQDKSHMGEIQLVTAAKSSEHLPRLNRAAKSTLKTVHFSQLVEASSTPLHESAMVSAPLKYSWSILDTDATKKRGALAIAAQAEMQASQLDLLAKASCATFELYKIFNNPQTSGETKRWIKDKSFFVLENLLSSPELCLDHLVDFLVEKGADTRLLEIVVDHQTQSLSEIISQLRKVLKALKTQSASW